MPSNPTTPPEPLNADIARQATGLFKGVDYQIWLTVLAWIDLAEEEILVIEGAEDFDVVTTATGLSVQVKALASPISLRSPSVVSAIQNFWETKHANRPRAIRFRFVTTADAAVEAGEPFGKEVAGLKFWNECRVTRTMASAETVRTFLLNDTSVHQQLEASSSPGVPPVIEFLRTAPAQEILEQLILPLTWDLRADGVDAAREAVRIRLHAYGELKALSIQDSDRALAPLFEYVAHKAIREKRTLSREDFRVVFDGATRESIPKSELALLRLVGVQWAQIPAMAIETAGWDTSLQGTIPPLPTPCCPRALLVTNSITALLQDRFLALSGSTGTGKSTLSKLIAERSGQQWLSVNCAGASGALVDFRLRQVAKHLAQEKRAISVLLDSFDFDGGELQAMCRSLAGTVLLVLRAGGCVVVTSKCQLPQLFRRELTLPDSAFITVPALTEEETAEFCALAGCRDPARLSLWSRLIWLQAQGHPQLTHARVSVAARRGWPPADPTELLKTPDEIKEERAMARQLLHALNEGQRELLYRLSVASCPFRRDHAIAASEIEPPISQAGDKFDALVGPWIEKRGNEYFRLSPLLSGSGEANWSATRLREIRVAYGKAVMRCGKPMLSEVNEALFQAILTQNDQLAAPVFARLMLAPLKKLPAVASELDWLFYFTGDQPVFPENSFVNLMLRQVQFRLAAASGHRHAAKLAELLNQESRQTFDPKLDDLMRDISAVEILLAVKVRVDPAILLQCWLDADRLSQGSPEVKEYADKIDKIIAEQPGFGGLGFSNTLFSFIFARKVDAGFFDELIVAVDALNAPMRERVFVAIRQNGPRLQTCVDNLWVSELSKPIREWDSVLKALAYIKDAGVRWKLTQFIIAAARGMAAVQDEYLNQPVVALQTLEAAANEAGEDAVMLRYQRGTIFSRQGRHQEAYEAWSSTLEHWEANDFDSSLQGQLAHANCGSAAGHWGRWTIAAEVFQRGRQFAQKGRRQLEATAFGADAAYSLWRAGKRAEAVTEFAMCLKEIEEMIGPDEPVSFHTLWKLIEQMIRWCAQDAGESYEMPVPMPRPGVCSELREKEQHEAVSKYPRGPLSWAWLRLAEAELCADLGLVAFNQLTARSDISKNPWLGMLVANFKLRRAFRDRHFEKLVPLVEEAAHATAIAKANPAEGSTLLTPNVAATQVADYTSEVAAWAPEVFASAFIAVLSTGSAPLKILEQWKKEAATAKSKFDYLQLFDEAERLLGSDPRSAYRAYATSNCSWFQHIVSGLRMATDPNATLQACFIGLATLVTDGSAVFKQYEIGICLGALAKRIWEERVHFPAEFNSPRISIPSIKAACAEPAQGLKLAARILLAATSAVSVRSLDKVLPQLRALAELPTSSPRASP